MKRAVSVMVSIFLLLGLTACGGNPDAEAAVSTAATEPAVTEVSTVDELLAAIAPDAEIVLAAGTYDLGDAADYGRKSASPYYSWIEVYDGYELRLRGVDGLSIRGSGRASTVISAEPRYANVLGLLNCSDVEIGDMTLGHTIEPGECAGGVLQVQGCWDVTFTGMGLYGCGVNGLKAQMSSNIRLEDSDLYDCSSSGVIAEDVEDLKILGCRIYDIGEEQYGGNSVFELTRSVGVEIEDCEITGNLVQTLLTGYPSESVTVRNCRIAENRIRSAAFDVYGMGLILDNNVLEENSVRNWYGVGIYCAVDAQGNELTAERLDAMHAVADRTAEETARTEVHVSTVDEFLAAIAPDTQIILDAERYDFSTATGYGITVGEYYYWEDIFDGPGLVISGVENFGISSNDGRVKGHTLAAVPRYANVLTFSQCSGITLSGFTAGHTEEPGSCTGGVVLLRDSDNVLVENCGLFGCGILGVQAEYCGNITVSKCDIYDCSYGGIEMRDVNGVVIDGCTFRDLGGNRIMLSGCRDITVDGNPVDGTVYIME